MKEDKLLKNLKRKRRDALEKAIAAYSGYVSVVVRGVMGEASSREDREEVVADTFVALWNHAEGLDERRESIRGYLGAIARNKAISWLRKRREETPEGDELILWAPGGVEPEAEAIRGELRGMLLEAVQEMEEEERDIFIRYYYRYRKINEISDELGLNPSTVKTKLARGRKKLKRILEERGYDCEDSDFGAV